MIRFYKTYNVILLLLIVTFLWLVQCILNSIYPLKPSINQGLTGLLLAFELMGKKYKDF